MNKATQQMIGRLLISVGLCSALTKMGFGLVDTMWITGIIILGVDLLSNKV